MTHVDPNESEAKRLDRLAWTQRLEDIERQRKKLRRKEWWLDKVEDIITYAIVAAAFLILLLTALLTLGGMK